MRSLANFLFLQKLYDIISDIYSHENNKKYTANKFKILTLRHSVQFGNEIFRLIAGYHFEQQFHLVKRHRDRNVERVFFRIYNDMT